MPAAFPYVMSSGKIKVIFDRISSAGRPAKADDSWLASVGLNAANDTRIKSVLVYLGFVDNSFVPTPMWDEYRSGDKNVVLARAIKSGYADLFHTYPDAEKQTQQVIERFMKSKSKVSESTISLAYSTFKALVNLADFTSSQTAPSIPGEPGPESDRIPQSNDDQIKCQPNSTIRRGNKLSVNVNVQLTLPETTDPAVYEAIFAAMSKHIINGLEDDE